MTGKLQKMQQLELENRWQLKEHKEDEYTGFTARLIICSGLKNFYGRCFQIIVSVLIDAFLSATNKKCIMEIHKAFRSVFVLLLTACTSTQTFTEQTATDTTVLKNPGTSVTLTDRLRTLPGVSVVGTGASAKITIRGNSSMLGENEPLFVVNGQPIQGGFSTLYGLVDVGDIEQMAVLKDSSSTSAYGVRGANGVIEVKTK